MSTCKKNTYVRTCRLKRGEGIHSKGVYFGELAYDTCTSHGYYYASYHKLRTVSWMRVYLDLQSPLTRLALLQEVRGEPSHLGGVAGTGRQNSLGLTCGRSVVAHLSLCVVPSPTHDLEHHLPPPKEYVHVCVCVEGVGGVHCVRV